LQNNAFRQSKGPHEDLGSQGMKIQETFENISKWRNFVRSPKTSLKEKKHS